MMLTKVVEVMQNAVGEDLPVKPFGIDEPAEAVCYTWTPQTDDGAVATGRLELRLITRTVAKAEELRKSLISTLVTVGDNPKNGYLGCYLNGGGTLWDDDHKMTHTILYLYITMKSEVNHNG